MQFAIDTELKFSADSKKKKKKKKILAEEIPGHLFTSGRHFGGLWGNGKQDSRRLWGW